MKNIRILFTGGGSGGHVYPLLAVSAALKKITTADQINLALYYMGPRDEYTEIIGTSGFQVKTVVTGKLRRYFSIKNLIDLPKFVAGFFDALFKLFVIMPDVIFSKGGTGALPVVVAGWFYRIPVIIHESDAVPGLTNLVSAWFAERVAVTFETALDYFNSKKVALVGTPVRNDLTTNIPTQEVAKRELGFKEREPLLLVVGGSQGSTRINNFILADLAGLLQETQVFHQTGQVNFAETEKLSRAALSEVPVSAPVKYRYRIVPYLDVVAEKNALAAADVVMARAGSGTISEIAAFEKPAILIPLKEAANNHQRLNAEEFAKGGAAVIIEEPNLLPGVFLNQFKNMISDKPLLDKMSRASGKFFKPGAAETIAQEILRLAG